MVQKTTKILDAEVVDYADDLSIPVQTTDAEGPQRISAASLTSTAVHGVRLNRVRIVDPVNVEVTTSGQFITIANSSGWTDFDEIELRLDLSYANEAPSDETPPEGDNRLVHLSRITTSELAGLTASSAETPDLSNTQYLGITGGPFPHATIINRLRSTATSFVLARDANNNLMITWNETGVHIYPLSVYGLSYAVSTGTPMLEGFTSWLHGVKEGTTPFSNDYEWDDGYGHRVKTANEIFPDINDSTDFANRVLTNVVWSDEQTAARTANTAGTATAAQQVIATNMTEIENELFRRAGIASRCSGGVTKFIRGPIFRSSHGSAPIPGVTWNGVGVARSSVDAHAGEFLHPTLTTSLDFSAADLTTAGYVTSNMRGDATYDLTPISTMLPNSVFILDRGWWSVEAVFHSAGSNVLNKDIALRIVDNVGADNRVVTSFREDQTDTIPSNPASNFYVNVGARPILRSHHFYSDGAGRGFYIVYSSRQLTYDGTPINQLYTNITLANSYGMTVTIFKWRN